MVVLFSGYVEINHTFEVYHVWCALTTENHLLKWTFTVIRIQKEMSGQGGDGGDRSDEAGAKRDWRVKIWVDKFPLLPNKALICKYVFVVTTEFRTSGGFLNRHWIQVHSRKYNNEELNFFTFKNSGEPKKHKLYFLIIYIYINKRAFCQKRFPFPINRRTK